MTDEPEPEPLDTAPVPTPRGPRGGRNLAAAIASGVLLAALFLGALAWDDYAVLTLIAVIITIGVLEVAIAFREHGLRPAVPVVLGSGLVCFYGAYVTGASGQTLGLVLLVIGALGWMLADRHRESVLASLGATCFITLWIPFCASFVGLLLAREGGEGLVLVVIALTVFSDIGAYAVARWGATGSRPPSARPRPGKASRAGW
jgi:phosphatidate cytidylyltransferase